MNFSWQNLKVTVAIVLTLCGAMTPVQWTAGIPKR